MHIYSVFDDAFAPYGKVLEGYNTAELLGVMCHIPLPENGTAYEMALPELEKCSVFEELQNRAYGGMPIQLGMCWGRNSKMNCLEYHKGSELNLGTHDLILLLAKQEEIVNGKLDTAKVKAFRVPAGVLVECYATTLHYAPCHVFEKDGFRMAVVLPKGTNADKPRINNCNSEDEMLFDCNKWLLAHPDSAEAVNGAYIGLIGANIDISEVQI